MNRIPAFARPIWRRGVELWDDARGPTGGNPLMKGLVVLSMAALVTTLLVVTDDDDPYAVEAIDATGESGDPAAPNVAGGDRTTDSSVLGVAGEIGRSDEAEAAGLASASDAARSADASAVVDYADALHRARLTKESESESTTTTAAPTTTVPPTTQPPTTAAPSSEAGSSSSESTTTTVGGDGTDTTADPATTDPTTTGTDSSGTSVPAETSTTVAETTTTTAAPSGQSGWVDSGNGVLLPPVLLAIRYCESRDNYQAANPSSSARGAYQFLTGSWAAYGHKDRYGVNQAHLASNAQQDEAALLTWERDGTRPWNASKSCWSSRI